MTFTQFTHTHRAPSERRALLRRHLFRFPQIVGLLDVSLVLHLLCVEETGNLLVTT